MEQKLYDAASRLPETDLSFADITVPTPLPGKTHKPIISIAACAALLICICLGTAACAAEIEEYNNAVEFFDEHDLSTEGLSRNEIKAVYRDIIRESFTYEKTAEVIEKNFFTNHVAGYEILQNSPTPEDIEKLWNSNQASAEGIHYKYHNEYKQDPVLNYDVHDQSFLEKYDGETLLWSVAVSDFIIDGYNTVSDGILIFGDTFRWSSLQATNGYIAKISENGDLLWQQKFSGATYFESIRFALENPDGSYAVFSNCDANYVCYRHLSTEGTILLSQKTETESYSIRNVVHFGDGYLALLASFQANDYAKIVKIDSLGNITDSFSYSEKDAYYYITDMIAFDNKVYLSAYAVPKPEDESRNAGGRYNIAVVLNYLHDNNIWSISPEELTPIVRENNTAMLLVCDPNSGKPEVFYSVEGSLGGKLAQSDSDTLFWDVESITSTFYSPATSAFTIGGSCQVFRYTFHEDGTLISQEKTGEITSFMR